MNDQRAEAYQLLAETLELCEINQCGIECEHVPTLRIVGEMLDVDTARKRSMKYGKKSVAEQYKEIDKEIKDIPKKEKNPYLELEYIKKQIEMGLTNEQILLKHNFNSNTYYSFLRKHDLENPNRWKQKYIVTKESLEKQIAMGKSNKEIAQFFGMKHQDSIKSRLIKFGLTNPNAVKRKGWKYES